MWDRYLELVVNLAARGASTLTTSISGLTPLATTDIVQNDDFPLRLRFVLPTNDSANPAEVVELADDAVIVFSGKDASALSGSSLLYYCDSFVAGSDDNGPYYQGILNTNTTEVAAAFAALSSAKATISVINEIEVQNADNTQRTSFQHACILRRQVFNGEATPTPGTPIYPAPTQILIPGRDLYTQSPNVGDDFVDIAIPASATRIGLLGILRPSSDTAPLSIVDCVRTGDTTVRVTFSADVAAEGYQVTILASTPTPYTGEASLAGAVFEGVVTSGSSTVDIAIPSGAVNITPLGVEMPAVDAAPITIAGVFRLSSTVARVFLSAAPAAANYKVRILAPAP
jgi:hypothetical protein